MAFSSRARHTFLVALCVMVLLVQYLSNGFSIYEASPLGVGASPHTAKSKNAFCTFLSEPTAHIKDAEEDYYFVGTRMLIYQTLHDPETKTNTSTPFVVMVNEEVPKWKRNRLVLDGASVIEVGAIKNDWIKPGNARWEHVMDKLHVFELVQYEKILLLDGDMVITRRLDPVFDEVSVLPNLGNQSQIRADEAPQPSRYLMAGNSGPGPEHGYPAERGTRLNAGFVLFAPSLDMYNHYLSVAKIEGRFPGGSPEQDLWNYVHRRDGNMPWQQVNPDWTVNSPNYGDYEHGIASIHEKYWRYDHDKRLKEVLLRSRWKMEGFFNTLDLSSA